MIMRTLCLTLLLVACPLFAQLETDTITISTSRQIVQQPDQVVFSVQVVVPQTASIDEVLAKLPGTGITAANLTGTSNYSSEQAAWNFTLTAPFSKISSTTALLVQLMQANPVSFYFQGTQVSQPSQSSCSQAVLISDAQAQAQKLAAAAGFSVGPVLAVSDGTLSQAPTAVQTFAVARNDLGFISSWYYAPLPPITCSATVKFRLNRYQ